MVRRTVRGILGAVALLTLTLGVAAPASAGETIKSCGVSTSAVGATTSTGPLTYVHPRSTGNCGTLGVRGNYVHVGGDSWTSWKYSTGYHDAVSINLKNTVRALHSTSVQNLLFYSYR